LLCILIGVVLVVTVVGHVIWLVVVGIFAGLRQEVRPPREEQAIRCGNCDDMIPKHERKCPGCGLTRSAGKEADELRVMESRLKAFRIADELDEETFRRMIDMIIARRGELRNQGALNREPTPAPGPDHTCGYGRNAVALEIARDFTLAASSPRATPIPFGNRAGWRTTARPPRSLRWRRFSGPASRHGLSAGALAQRDPQLPRSARRCPIRRESRTVQPGVRKG
jgi:hypothetical protein